MGFEKLLKVTKAQFEKLLRDIIARENYNVHYSYTKMDYYISGDEDALDKLKHASEGLTMS